MRVCNDLIFNNADMSGSLNSTPFLLDQNYGYSIQLTWTGTSVGTFTLQLSNDVGTDQFGAGVTNWTTLANSSNAVSAAGTLAYNVNLAFYKWVRVVYTRTSGGTASLIGRLFSKGV